jgi:hypothetical protein
MASPPENLTADVRQFPSRRLIERVVRDLGMVKVFNQSQTRDGYSRACDSWHSAYWKWVDDKIPAQTVQRWQALQPNWSRVSPADVAAQVQAQIPGFELPAAESERKRWVEEFFRQEHFQQISLFQLAMRGPEATDPKTYDLFARNIWIASEIGDATFSGQLATQKRRKPTRDIGNRRLKPQLLVHWIPGCLWAFTTDGVAQFLDRFHPRLGSKLYDNRTISDACRALKLYRLPWPLWWGISGTPPSLQPLR